MAKKREMMCEHLDILDITYGYTRGKTCALVSAELKNELYIGCADLVALCIILLEFLKQLPKDFMDILVRQVMVAVTVNLVEWIQKENMEVLSDMLRNMPMAGPPMHIYLKEGEVCPQRLLTARQVLLHLQEQVQKVVDKALADGILERVMEPTEWISPGSFMPKEGGNVGLWLVMDLSHLYKYVKSPIHPFPSTRVSSNFFMKMDTVQGYFQIPLDKLTS